MSAVDAPRPLTGEPGRRRPAPAPLGWAAAGPAVARRAISRDLRWPIALTVLLAGAFALRVWGARQGLPWAYNSDENAHFVPKAIGFFGHDWNPHYFVNPPAFTELLHVVFAVWFGGRQGVSQSFAADPTEVFVVARVTAAVVGTIAIGLLYLAGARMFDRRVGLLAAGVLSVAFLPVFYSHLALNDVPTLGPMCLALVGTAGILRGGRMPQFAIAGVGLGLACATKYTGGIVLLPIIAAAATCGWRRGIAGLVLAGACSFAAFVVGNPYALLDFHSFQQGLNHQTTVADASGGKLGLTEKSGFSYYLWTLTWGLGWIPALAALAGAVLLAVRRSWLFVVLVPAPLLFFLFMGSQVRFFGRWMLPLYPLLALLAAYAAFQAIDAFGANRPALRPTLVAVAVVALCVQGVLSSVHIGLVLSRDDTRNITRAWMVRNVPATSKIVVEPGVMPDTWVQDPGHPSPLTSNGNRWIKYSTSRSFVDAGGRIDANGPGHVVTIEDYERSLYPGLIDAYERRGYCWVVSGSIQSGRAFAQPGAVPNAVRYYQRLDHQADVVFRASPYTDLHKHVAFNFDWSFDYEPLAYHRPGPLMTVYHLHGGACAHTS